MNSDENPKSYYLENGYFVFPKLIPDALVDRLIEIYQEDILHSDDYFFRQSSNRWEKNSHNEYGHARESFRDIHDYPKHKNFSSAALDIFCSPQIRDALATLTDAPKLNLMQSMFFDLNTATPAHQDSYYLDSLPNGQLLGAWFALEDIHEDAGRFWVIPGTQKIDFALNDAEKSSNGEYLKKMSSFFDATRSKLIAPPLKKGDVLFWNSWTLHGSLQTTDPKRSRKSLTAHYLPAELGFGSRHNSTPYAVDYGSHQGMLFRKVPPVHSEFTIKHKLYTDAMQFLWYRPRLRKIARAAWRVKKLLSPSPQKS